jgi:hypothetical protein
VTLIDSPRLFKFGYLFYTSNFLTNGTRRNLMHREIPEETCEKRKKKACNYGKQQREIRLNTKKDSNLSQEQVLIKAFESKADVLNVSCWCSIFRPSLYVFSDILSLGLGKTYKVD